MRNKILFTLAALALSLASGQAQKNDGRDTVVVNTVLHCDNCIQNVTRNLPFEKGVKDIAIDFEGQKVTVVYDPAKTDPEKILKAFARIKIPAELPKKEQ